MSSAHFLPCYYCRYFPGFFLFVHRHGSRFLLTLRADSKESGVLFSLLQVTQWRAIGVTAERWSLIRRTACRKQEHVTETRPPFLSFPSARRRTRCWSRECERLLAAGRTDNWNWLNENGFRPLKYLDALVGTVQSHCDMKHSLGVFILIIITRISEYAVTHAFSEYRLCFPLDKRCYVEAEETFVTS